MIPLYTRLYRSILEVVGMLQRLPRLLANTFLLLRWQRNLPCLNSSGCSEITQCPASISASTNLGKNFPIIGRASSGTYLLCVPRTNNAGFSNRTSSGSLNGKSPRLSSADASIRNGILNFCVFSSAGRCRLPKRNWRMGRDCRVRY
jgi:hypothetical protein